MAMRPRSQVGPVPSFEERAGNTVDVIQAVPRGNKLSERSGERWAEEGLGFEPSISGAFIGATSYADANRQSYDVQIAPNRRSRLGAGEEIPAWDAVGPELLSNFEEVAALNGDGGQEYAPPFSQRRGANTNTLGPTFGLDRGERQGQVIVAKIAPEGGGRGRRNPSDVSFL